MGDPDGIVIKLGNKRRLQSGQTFQYTTSRGLDMSYSKSVSRETQQNILEGALSG